MVFPESWTLIENKVSFVSTDGGRCFYAKLARTKKAGNNKNSLGLGIIYVTCYWPRGGNQKKIEHHYAFNFLQYFIFCLKFILVHWEITAYYYDIIKHVTCCSYKLWLVLNYHDCVDTYDPIRLRDKKHHIFHSFYFYFYLFFLW